MICQATWVNISFKYLIWLIFWKSNTLSQSWCNANPATRGSWECIHKHWTPSSNAVPAGRFPLVLLYSYFLSNCCPLMRVLTFLRPLPSPFRTQFSDLGELLLGPPTEFMVQQTHALDWGSPMLGAINVMLCSLLLCQSDLWGGYTVYKNQPKSLILHLCQINKTESLQIKSY